MSELDKGLWAHQVEASNKAVDGNFSFFLDPGTGKTLTMITTLRKIFLRKKRALKTLVLCPAIVIDNWEDEFYKFSKCGDLVQKLKGPKSQRIKDIETSGKSIFVTNYEALDMDGLFIKKKGSINIVIPRGFEVLVLDESHRCKNPSGKRTKTLIKMADKIGRKYLLSGTPILNSEMDIWAQYRILDGGESFGQNFFSFRGTYFHDRNAGMPALSHFPNWQIRPGLQKVINERIYKKGYRVLKKDCLDLPPFVETRITVEISGEQKKHYNNMLNDYVTYLENEECTASIALTRALRLQQIISGFLPLDEKEPQVFAGTHREKVLSEIIEDRLGTQLIIWAVWKENYKTIARICEKLGVPYCFLTGLQSQKEKEESLEEFRSGRKPIIIANPNAGGTGVNLIEAETAIWYSRNFSLEARLQAQARNYRGGSEMHKKVTQIDLYVPGTIEEHCLEALSKKQNIAANILEFSRRVLAK